MFTPFHDRSGEPAIRGFMHAPPDSNGHAIALTHGAGGNCQSKFLVALADALASGGFLVLRFDLPFRVARSFGPPRPGSAALDREGLRRAAALLRSQLGPAHALASSKTNPATPAARVFLGGHSYGGRQASMLLAEDPHAADGLLLLSYPLHPPKKPDQLRTKHFPQLSKPTFFVHGSRDPFATTAELASAMEHIPAPHAVLEVENAGHDLLVKKQLGDLPARVASEFLQFVAGSR